MCPAPGLLPGLWPEAPAGWTRSPDPLPTSPGPGWCLCVLHWACCGPSGLRVVWALGDVLLSVRRHKPQQCPSATPPPSRAAHGAGGAAGRGAAPGHLSGGHQGLYPEQVPCDGCHTAQVPAEAGPGHRHAPWPPGQAHQLQGQGGHRQLQGEPAWGEGVRGQPQGEKHLASGFELPVQLSSWPLCAVSLLEGLSPIFPSCSSGVFSETPCPLGRLACVLRLGPHTALGTLLCPPSSPWGVQYPGCSVPRDCLTCVHFWVLGIHSPFLEFLTTDEADPTWGSGRSELGFAPHVLWLQTWGPQTKAGTPPELPRPPLSKRRVPEGTCPGSPTAEGRFGTKSSPSITTASCHLRNLRDPDMGVCLSLPCLST